MSKQSTDQANQEQLIELADEIFELTTMVSSLRSRMHTEDAREPTETEFLALDILAKGGKQNVGEIQREIGILPAQMSRLIRSLEAKGGLVECRINENDRRKIDVKIAPKGRNAHQAYRAARLHFATQILKDLSRQDRKQFMRILGDIRSGIANRLSNR